MKFSLKRLLMPTLLAFALGLVTSCGGGKGVPSGDGGVSKPSRSGVAVFSNDTYVDYTDSASSSEAYNLTQTLASLGETVTTFTGITSADFSGNATGDTLALAIPELENGILSPNLDAAAKTAIANYVNGGGTLLIFGTNNDTSEDGDFLNSIFGFSIVSTHADAVGLIRLTAAAVGTPFSGEAATILGNDATTVLTTASLPAGAKVIYSDNNGDTVVMYVPVGSGHVVYLGYDWYDAAPFGTQDGGWVSVLDAALNL